MASPGLLILLLASCCLPVFSIGEDEYPHTKDVQGLLKKKNKNESIKKNALAVGEAIANSASGVPVVGVPLALGANAIMKMIPQEDKLNTVKSEVRYVNAKLDTLNIGITWQTWAAGAYHIPVNNIEKSWFKYIELERSGQGKSPADKEELKKTFFTYYSQYEDSTLILYQYLTATPISITENLGDLLANKLGCHEKEIKTHFLYLNKLMLKGNNLNEIYYKFKGANVEARANSARDIASQSALALAKSHQRCISHNAAHIERDILEQIDDSDVHTEIEKNIRAFLAEKYDRYDWMVAAYSTHNSKQLSIQLKRHVVRGFTKVERGSVTVAVAKQPKGTHTMAAAVKKAIEQCLPKDAILCYDVDKKLRDCQETVSGKRLSETYTAVHISLNERQGAINAEEAPDEEAVPPLESYDNVEAPSAQTPYVYIGKCGKIRGSGKKMFIVFIKSDEEIMGVNPCSKVNCGRGGKCIEPTKFIAMCECQYPYYGESCEKSLESYRRELQREIEDLANRRFRSNSPESPPVLVYRSNIQQKYPGPSEPRSNIPKKYPGPSEPRSNIPKKYPGPSEPRSNIPKKYPGPSEPRSNYPRPLRRRSSSPKKYPGPSEPRSNIPQKYPGPSEPRSNIPKKYPGPSEPRSNIPKKYPGPSEPRSNYPRPLRRRSSSPKKYPGPSEPRSNIPQKYPGPSRPWSNHPRPLRRRSSSQKHLLNRRVA